MSDVPGERGGKLSIVATPIGNMGDMTFRGLWILKECSAIYAEDTRVVSKLLAHYGLRTPVFRLDAATEGKKALEVARRLEAGERIAYVSDAGTPGVSDPGARLVSFVRKELPDAKIEAIPGPSALTAALSVAGVDATAFTFLGFLPHKKGRQTALKSLVKSEIPTILYESPHRIPKLLTELKETAPKAHVTVLKELTKIHEAVYRGKASDVAQALEKAKAVRGEFVVIIEP